MCAPCVIIITGCGLGNNSAASFINANEQFAEAIKYMADAGTLSAADSDLVLRHCSRYAAAASQLDDLTKDTLLLSEAIARRTKNPHPHIT